MKGELTKMKLKTALLHQGRSIDDATGALSIPISQASTFQQRKVGDFVYEYARTGNPTREALELLIRDVEQGDRGFAFASGMAAISTVMDLFSAGDHLIITSDVYGGTYRLFTQVLAKRQIAVDFVDTSNEENVERAITPQTKALFIETPTNPLLNITSIQTMSKLAKEYDLLLIVDNTFSTPYWQNPIVQGADIVVHSATKYLGGHSDVVAGLVVTGRPSLSEQIAFLQNSTGAVLAPHDSWLVQRGMKTLGLRMEAIEKNAREIAHYLSTRSEVEEVYYPNRLESSLRKIHESQARGYGGMISFRLPHREAAHQFVENVHYFTLAESLGAVESLVSIPAEMTHASIPRERRLTLGITDGLVRLSVGIEHIDDLLKDISQALDHVRLML